MKLSNTFKMAAATIALTATGALASDLTVTSWGGGYTASQQKAYGEPWEAKTGKSIHWENYNGGLGEVRTQVESGNVTWDIVDVLPDQIRTGCDEGLFIEVPDDIFVKTADGKSMDEDLMVPRPNKCAIPQIWRTYQAFYNEGTFSGEQPDTIMDFFDTAAFPGKRGVHTWANAIRSACLALDTIDPIPPAFHLSIWARLTTYLGFAPNLNASNGTNYFDLHNGNFVPEPPLLHAYLQPEASENLRIALESSCDAPLHIKKAMQSLDK